MCTQLQRNQKKSCQFHVDLAWNDPYIIQSQRNIQNEYVILDISVSIISNCSHMSHIQVPTQVQFSFKLRLPADYSNYIKRRSNGSFNREEDRIFSDHQGRKDWYND